MLFLILTQICTIYLQFLPISSVFLPTRNTKPRTCFITFNKSPLSPIKHKVTHNYVTLSGIQPTGELHIGNYSGLISPSLDYQASNDDLHLMIADNHAISGENWKNNLKKFTKSTIALCIAFGINPEKTTIFVQSHFPQILEMSWLISSLVRTGKFYKLSRFRNRGLDISDKNLATFLYPLLMSSDILTLNASKVIAGSDQKIHLTLARYIARKMNHSMGSNLFTPPQIANPKTYTVKSLSDGTKKMSKSSNSGMDTINILDSEDTIFLKLKAAKTQCTEDATSPEIRNLIRIYSICSNKPYSEVARLCDTSNFFKFKKVLSTCIVDFLKPIKRKYYEIIDDDHLFERILTRSREKLTPYLDNRLKEIKQLFSFYTI